MLTKIWNLLHEADLVFHFNGTSFDIPWLNAEFLRHCLPPYSPIKQLDLCTVSKKLLYLPSHKLEFLVDYFGIGQKMKHQGFPLWAACMDHDPKAWKAMREYNEKDVTLLESWYNRLQPWIPNHPHVRDSTIELCPSCGSLDIGPRGVYRAKVAVYRRYSCRACGSWFRGNKMIAKHHTVGVS